LAQHCTRSVSSILKQLANMEALGEAIASKRPIKLHSNEAMSVAALVPVKRSHDSVALGLDDKRYLRIVKTGKTDLNGGRGGPWTEFNVTAHSNGALFFHGVKSGRWLTVTNGAFVSSEQPEPLLLEFGMPMGEPASTHEDEDSGMWLHLADGSAALPWPVQLSQKGSHVLLVTDAGNVACGPEGKFHKRGQGGKWAQWAMEEAVGGVCFKNIGHGRYLSLGAQGSPELADAPALFSVTASMVGGKSSADLGPEMPPVDASVLSASDIAHFKDLGYVIVRNAVPPELIRDALRSINHQLGRPDCWEADKDPLNNNAAQLTLKLNTGVGQDIFKKSPVLWSAINILLGAGNVAPPPRARGTFHGQQVALRFPQPPEVGHDVPDVKAGTRYHIDGMGQNKLCPFTLLCGVALSEQTRANMGNLHVFPGSHLNEDVHKYYLEKIDDDNQNEADEHKPNLGESVQVLLRPGDVVLAHQLLAHRVGVNTSEHIRYQLYYRVPHKDHAQLKDRVVFDPWVEFAV